MGQKKKAPAREPEKKAQPKAASDKPISPQAPELPASAAAGREQESGSPSVADKIAGLDNASPGALRAEWRRLFGTDPPALSRDLLARAIAYRLQERAFGGLSRTALRRLEEMSNQPDGEPPPPESAPTLRPGARLVREWHGRAHVVTATDVGFDYAGSSHGSLTEIAKIITGAHWSGPRFFGLRSRKPARQSAPAEAPSNGGCDPAIDASDLQESAHG